MNQKRHKDYNAIHLNDKNVYLKHCENPTNDTKQTLI